MPTSLPTTQTSERKSDSAGALAPPELRRPLIRWLTVVGAMILLMILVGGVTRLTESGLSMVDWRPFMGAIPPTSDAEWREVFERYQQYPEYRELNTDMTLEQFKQIFFWEYLHRLLGRLLGLVFLLPWIYFAVRKKIPAAYNLRFAALFVLGAAQGLMGWYMVQSGLVDVPYVSHYRLAAHLALALAALCLTLWFILDLRRAPRPALERAPARLRKTALTFTTLVALQILYGAFMAGLDAGFGANTFPTMNGQWIPAGLWTLEPTWRNLFDNNITVQFIHRTLGWIVFFAALALWWRARKLQAATATLNAVNAVLLVTCLQFMLGVVALVSVVAIPLAVAHQLGAAALLLTAVTVNHKTLKAT